MTKLVFFYGTVCSGKTLQLIGKYNVGKQSFSIKPAIDTRFGKNKIKSRAGVEIRADAVVEKYDDLTRLHIPENVQLILVDEVQFFSRMQIEQLHQLSKKINVYAYGLLTSWRGLMFEASKRLIEIADKREEIEVQCHECSEKANFNLKIAGNNNSDIELGGLETYKPVCKHHWKTRHI